MMRHILRREVRQFRREFIRQLGPLWLPLLALLAWFALTR